VGDREIRETYLNSSSKIISETDVYPHGTKPFLTNVIGPEIISCFHKYTYLNNKWKLFVNDCIVFREFKPSFRKIERNIDMVVMSVVT